MGGPVRDWTMWSTGPGSRHPRADPRHLDAHCCPLQPARLVLLPRARGPGWGGPVRDGTKWSTKGPPRLRPHADRASWTLTATPAARRLVLLPCARGRGWGGPMRDRMKWSTGGPPQDRAHVLTQPPGCSLLPPAARPPCGSQRRPAEPLPDPAVPLFCRVLVHLQ